MAIQNPQPPQIDGVSYDLLSVALAMSTIPRDGRMVLDIAVTFTPYRDGQSGPEILEAGRSSLIYADAMALAMQAAQQGDSYLAQFLGALELAAQQFINAKV
jgi:hypothetical protein